MSLRASLVGVDRAEHNEILQFWLVRRGRKGFQWLSVYANKPRLNTVKSNTLASRHGSAEVPLCPLSARVCRGALARLQNAPVVIGKKNAKFALYWQSFHCLVGELPNLAFEVSVPVSIRHGASRPSDHQISPGTLGSYGNAGRPSDHQISSGIFDYMGVQGNHLITRYDRGCWIIRWCRATT